MVPQRREKAGEVHSQEAPATRVKERMIYQQQKQKAMQKTAGEQFTQRKGIHLVPKTNKARDGFQQSRDTSYLF